MGTKVWFQNYAHTGEQRLLDGLVNESIRIYGTDTYYLPRNLTNFDQLLVEDAQSTFEKSYMIEMYLKTFSGFMGDRNLMSKFAGLEIRDQIIYTVARSAFNEHVGMTSGLTRPREGDVVYFPLNKKCFVVRYVEAHETMYQLGTLYSWDLTLELFEYSDEKFNTGIPEIDALNKFSTNAIDYALKDENGNWLLNEANSVITNENFKISKIDPMAQNETIDNLSLDLDLIDFDEVDPFSEGKLGNR